MATTQYAPGWRVPARDTDRDRLCTAVGLWSGAFKDMARLHALDRSELDRKAKLVELLAVEFRERAAGVSDWVVPNAPIQKAFRKDNLNELWKSVWNFQKEHVERTQRNLALAQGLPVVMFSRLTGTEATSAQYQLWEWVEHPTTWLEGDVPCFSNQVVPAPEPASSGPTHSSAPGPSATATSAGQERPASGGAAETGERSQERERRRQQEGAEDVHVRLLQRFLIQPQTHVVVTHSGSMLQFVMLWIVLIAVAFALLLLAHAIDGLGSVVSRAWSWFTNNFSSSPVPSIR